MQLGGVLTALATPYDESGGLDLHALNRHVSRLKSTGVHGFFACGTTGEGALLSRDEKHQVITAVVDVAADDVPVVAAVIQPDTRGAVEEAESYAGLGVRFVAAVAPYYVRVDQSELIAHFTAIADAAACPVLAYDIPGNTSNPLTDDVYEEVLKHPNIIGVKDSSGNFSNFSRRVIAQKRSGVDDTAWIQGEDTLDGVALLAGASGVVSGLSNVLPEPFVRMFAAAGKGDVETVFAMQHVINTLHLIVRSTGKGVAPVRLALSQMGYGSRYLRTRSFSLGPEWDEPIRRAVEEARALYQAQ